MRKLSEMSTDECFNALVALAEPGENIVCDEKIMNVIGKAVDKKGVSRIGMLVFGARKIFGLLPLVLMEHRGDIYKILAIMSKDGKSEEYFAKQNFIATMNQIRSLADDRELLDFFRSLGRGGKSEQ